MKKLISIFIFCLVLGSCTKIDRATSVQITPESAAEIISSQDPLLYQETPPPIKKMTASTLCYLLSRISFIMSFTFLEHKKAFYLFQGKK